MAAKSERPMAPGEIQSVEARSADPMRKQLAPEPKEGYARIWFRPTSGTPRPAYRDILPTDKIIDLATGEKVLELDMWRKKLADKLSMRIHSIVTEKGKVLELGTPTGKA